MPCYSSFDFSMESLNSETTREPGAQSTLLKEYQAGATDRGLQTPAAPDTKSAANDKMKGIYPCAWLVQCHSSADRLLFAVSSVETGAASLWGAPTPASPCGLRAPHRREGGDPHRLLSSGARVPAAAVRSAPGTPRAANSAGTGSIAQSPLHRSAGEFLINFPRPR